MAKNEKPPKPPAKEERKAAPAAPKAAPPKPATPQIKKNFLIGIGFIVFAFVCIISVFYAFGFLNQKTEEELGRLKEKTELLKIENSTKESELAKLKEELNTIKLDHIFKKADKVYRDEEKGRKEGVLWVDRKAAQYIVTLGALNGLGSGSLLNVYDNGKKIGEVKVEIPLDVISYVSPVGRVLDNTEGTHFKVMVE